MEGLAISLVLAMILGFAAHRASICTVRAVAETMHSGTAFMFASIGKSILWILAVTLPVYWLFPNLIEGLVGWQLSATALAGGFLFGLGAGVNGACAYSTMARLVDGEAAMLIAIAGFALGVGLFVGCVDAGLLQRPEKSLPVIGAMAEWGGAIAILLLVWAAYELVRLWRTRQADKSFLQMCTAPAYRLSSAAFLIGVTGSAIFILFGSAGYSTTFGLVVEGGFGTRPWPTPGRWLLLVAVLFGMLLSTLQRSAFQPALRPRIAWYRNFVGGALMGFGVVMAPGGNDAFVLYGVPNLSPNAMPAYAAMTIGIVVALVTIRILFGIETRAVCRGDMFVSDSWTPDGTKIVAKRPPVTEAAN